MTTDTASEVFEIPHNREAEESVIGALFINPDSFHEVAHFLEAEDFYYVGFHFSEKLNEERRFGEDILRHLKKKWSRGPIAKLAREKLKIEGH